jgi:hypothetical protein
MNLESPSPLNSSERRVIDVPAVLLPSTSPGTLRLSILSDYTMNILFESQEIQLNVCDVDETVEFNHATQTVHVPPEFFLPDESPSRIIYLPDITQFETLYEQFLSFMRLQELFVELALQMRNAYMDGITENICDSEGIEENKENIFDKENLHGLLEESKLDFLRLIPPRLP